MTPPTDWLVLKTEHVLLMVLGLLFNLFVKVSICKTVADIQIRLVLNLNSTIAVHALNNDENILEDAFTEKET